MLTRRLELIAATVPLCDADLNGPRALGGALGAHVPASWRPPVFEADDIARVRRRLATTSEPNPWTLYYVVRRYSPGVEREVVGVAGFTGPPDNDGSVVIGYAIAEEHQRQGYATEAVTALLEMADAAQDIDRVVATTYDHLTPSIGVLEKSGFVAVSRDEKTRIVRFERQRNRSTAGNA